MAEVEKDEAIVAAAFEDVPEGFEGIAELADEIPDVSLMYAPEAYEPMDPDTRGAWRFLLDGNETLGMMWTDWKGSVGIVQLEDTDDGATARLEEC